MAKQIDIRITSDADIGPVFFRIGESAPESATHPDNPFLTAVLPAAIRVLERLLMPQPRAPLPNGPPASRAPCDCDDTTPTDRDDLDVRVKEAMQQADEEVRRPLWAGAKDHPEVRELQVFIFHEQRLVELGRCHSKIDLETFRVCYSDYMPRHTGTVGALFMVQPVSPNGAPPLPMFKVGPLYSRGAGVADDAPSYFDDPEGTKTDCDDLAAQGDVLDVQAPAPVQDAADPTTTAALDRIEAKLARLTEGRARWTGYVSAYLAAEAERASGSGAEIDMASALMAIGSPSAYGTVRAYIINQGGLAAACIDALCAVGYKLSPEVVKRGKAIAVDIRSTASALRLIDLADLLEASLESERPLTGDHPTGPTVGTRDNPRNGYLSADSEPSPLAAPLHLLNQGDK